MKNIAIVVHKYLPQPDDDLVYFLNRKKNINIFHIKHSFSDAKDRCSALRKYLNGLQIDEIKTIDYKFLPEVLIYIKSLFYC